MENIIIANLFVSLIVTFICVFIGLDLKKWQSWLVGVHGFLSGCLIGFLTEARSPSWQAGMIFAIVIILSGAVIRQQRIYYRKAGEEWLMRYGQEKQYSFLARLIKKALRK